MLAIYFEGVFPFSPGPIELFAGPLASGAAPSLRDLVLELEYAELEDNAIEALVAMFESCAQHLLAAGWWCSGVTFVSPETVG